MNRPLRFLVNLMLGILSASRSWYRFLFGMVTGMFNPALIDLLLIVIQPFFRSIVNMVLSKVGAYLVMVGNFFFIGLPARFLFRFHDWKLFHFWMASVIAV